MTTHSGESKVLFGKGQSNAVTKAQYEQLQAMMTAGLPQFLPPAEVFRIICWQRDLWRSVMNAGLPPFAA